MTADKHACGLERTRCDECGTELEVGQVGTCEECGNMNPESLNKIGPWTRGAPPSIGWWPASIYRDSKYLRWWDGVMWSRPVTAGDSSRGAALSAAVHSAYSNDVWWKSRPKSWPARSFT